MTTILADRKKCTIYADTLCVDDFRASGGWNKTFQGLGFAAGLAGDFGKYHTIAAEFAEYTGDPCRKIPWDEHDHLGDLMPILESLPEKLGEISELVVVTANQQLFLITKCGLHDIPLDFEAIGTGAVWALSATQLGRGGKKAVEHAMQNDAFTGGDIVVATAKKEL